nr:MAG TPA: Terminase small subunit [Caudoviricetes sp.]
MTKETEKEKEAKKHLNKRQIDFIQEYMKTNNITQSATKAGYSPKTAAVQGCNLLKNVKVRNYIDAINERLESEKIADIQEVMEYLTAVMRGEAKDQFDMDVSIQDRTRAAGELARRLDVKARNINIEGAVNIIDNIPNEVDENEED